MSAYHIAATYSFFPIDDPALHQEAIRSEAARLDIRGIFVLAPEGLNTTCAAPSRPALDAWIGFLQQHFQIRLDCKYSQSARRPFKRLAFKLRPEICTTGNTRLEVDNSQNHHLDPAQWDTMLDDPDSVVIDTRNHYEYELGSFRGAINPRTDSFREFFDKVEEMDIPRDRNIMIFCTGGIRCHKGIVELQRRGYHNVWQLQGGILRYLEERPAGSFQGDCFVFDHRVAVGPDLLPVPGLGLCVHCGNPAREQVPCVRGDGSGYVCTDCQRDPVRGSTCSKDCANKHAASLPA
ncbi:sulfurtransferase [Spirochaeta africana]|uniref:Putative sulfurtransferase n=1 Tax=Spirochaeta africana (strain ATCC 700263 / DSM 8902 / Z-7692) TaxID=889378 RepID=H9ULE8_SPIAZ|nr:sulfurtransferase [Spirochaeta africana]AFG38341.1 putative sulfurtransferase [Spirochaeta africana DSM 8902]